jgi:hypothetical protein
MFKFKWLACFLIVVLVSGFITGCSKEVQSYRYPSQQITSIASQQKEVNRFKAYVNKHISGAITKAELVAMLGKGEVIHKLDGLEIWEYQLKFDPAYHDFDFPENLAKFAFLKRKIGAELFVRIKGDDVVSNYELHYIKPIEFKGFFNKVYLYSRSEEGHFGKEQLAPYIAVNGPFESVGYQNAEINRFVRFVTQALEPGTSAVEVMRYFGAAPFLSEVEGPYEYWKYAVLIDPTFEMIGIPPEYAGYRNRKIAAEVMITMNKSKNAVEKYDLYYLNLGDNPNQFDYNTLYRFDPERQQEIINIRNK